jgi:hypothetical protein
MAVEKLTKTARRRHREFHYDHADDTVAVTQTQDDAPIREYVAQQRLAGAKYVEGMGYEIATLPVTRCANLRHAARPSANWYYRPEYNDEMRKLIALARTSTRTGSRCDYDYASSRRRSPTGFRTRP